jgi:hypothetical protein
MTRILEIDQALYAVDDNSRTYWFFSRNPSWKTLDPQKSCRNQKSLEGYTRILRSGRKKVFPLEAFFQGGRREAW